jgi:hypothetical protein
LCPTTCLLATTSATHVVIVFGSSFASEQPPPPHKLSVLYFRTMGQKQSAPSTVVETESKPSTQPNQDGASESRSIAAMVERQSNPSEEDSRLHNFGQPIRPPHSTEPQHTSSSSAVSPDYSTSNFTKKQGSASKLVTDCRVQQRASLQCIEENYENKDQACAPFFDAYKQCRRDEHERKLVENARSTGGQRHGFW